MVQNSTAELSRRNFEKRLVAAALSTALPATAELAEGVEESAGRQPDDTGLSAGAAELAVSPAAKGTLLIGPMKPSSGIHDDLHARALVLSDATTKVAIITLDYLGFDFAYTDRLLDAASEASGIASDHVLLNCSHTHSAPLTAPWGPWERKKNMPFHERLPQAVAEVARRAVQRLVAAKLRYRREPTQIGFNRRLLHQGRITMAPNPNGAVLPWTDVLSVDREDGTPLAVLFSYAAHPVIVHAASTQISGDYPAFAVQHLRQSLGANVTSLFVQGCSGNINAFPLQGGIEAAEAAGGELGKAVERALAKRERLFSGVPLRVVSSELELPLQPPPPRGVLEKELASEKNSERRLRLEELRRIAEANPLPRMRFPMRAVSFGPDFCLLGLPHEPFAEYHTFVDEISPFPNGMVLGYTNGLECYVGTAKDYELGERGGYETSPWGAAFMFESRLPLAAVSEKLIRDGILALVKRLSSK